MHIICKCIYSLCVHIYFSLNYSTVYRRDDDEIFLFVLGKKMKYSQMLSIQDFQNAESY